ncbi:MAG: arylsulfatase [Bacteroidota bacterium]
MRFVILLCLIFSSVSLFAQVNSPPPNVILIVIDDQGYGDFACHGNELIKTPHLDQLYEQSLRLTNFHVSPTCSPTRASLMTGHDSNRTGVWHTIAGRSLLYRDEVAMPAYFLANGYATGMFGKWHLGDNPPFRPMDRGFQEAVYHGGGGVWQGPDYWGNDYFDDVYFRNGVAESFSGYCTDVWFEEAMGFMEEKQREEKPFFCYLATNAPHGPFWVEDRYADPYRDKPEVPNPNFYGMIANVDENIGKLMRYLERNQMRDNTLLIFMTDNGTAAGVRLDPKTELASSGFNAGMRGQKGSMYEGGHRVPCWISWPKGKLAVGKDLNQLTAHVDLLPSLLDLLDLNWDGTLAFDGESIVPALKDPAASLGDRIRITDSQRLEVPEKWRRSAVMQGDWRLINGESLYNVADDPGQQNNLAATHSEKVNVLRNAYDKWWGGLQAALRDTAWIDLPQSTQTPMTIFVHDMHMDAEGKPVPWNQSGIRKGQKSMGWFAINVPQAARYRISLYRWPPEIQQALTAGLDVQAALPGTSMDGLAEGSALSIQKAGVSVSGENRETDVIAQEAAIHFELSLQQGHQKLRTWFTENDDVAFAPNYVVVERLRAADH